MTRKQIIEANDQLRQFFRGGRVEVCHGPYDLDDRLIGGMLCALTSVMTRTKETQIQAAICDYLAYKGYLFSRTNNAPMHWELQRA